MAPLTRDQTLAYLDERLRLFSRASRNARTHLTLMQSAAKSNDPELWEVGRGALSDCMVLISEVAHEIRCEIPGSFTL
ncbi:MAG TPA: hypothetical protein VGG42_09990 [Acidobacteriaceae bacterium]